MIHGLYTATLMGAMAGYAPVALARSFTRGVPLNLRARLGHDPRPRHESPSGWIHAVSVGESITAMPLVAALRARHPGLPLVVTTVTETGATVVREQMGAVAEHRYFPLDLPRAVDRAMRAINPAVVVCMETELWPNLVRGLHGRGIPLMIANGRLSDRSFRRYAMIRRLLRPTLERIGAFAMQSEEDARRMVALGAPASRVVVTGNMKHDATAPEATSGDTWRRRLGLAPGRRAWVAGSTHPGEEDLVLAAHALVRRTYPDLVLVVAPRHPERAAEVAGLVQGHGWPVARRSALTGPLGRDAVMILDTVGELAEMYAIADVVFVGGSLVPRGGHNVLEPARLGKPVIVGPHTANFREAAALLESRGGSVVVSDGAALAARLAALLADESERDRVGEAARRAATSRHGAVEKTAELVSRLLEGP